MKSDPLIASDITYRIIGIGINHRKAVEDFRYIFAEKLHLKDTIEWEKDKDEVSCGGDRYICCTYEQADAKKLLNEKGLVYKKDYYFAEDFFDLLNEWKGCRVAYRVDKTNIRSRIVSVIMEYAAKHGKVLPNDPQKDVLKGHYSAESRGNKKNRSVTAYIYYAYCLFFGTAEIIGQFIRGSKSYKDYDYICFYNVADAIRFKKDNPSLSKKVITAEELKTHTLAPLYMKRVYFDKRQNACVCDEPFGSFWVGKAGTTRICDCPAFLDVGCGHIGVTEPAKLWGSQLAKILRLSVINRTYTFCSRELCRKVRSHPDQPELLDRIVKLEEKEYPKKITIAYDRVCNLHCPSCRKNSITKNSENEEAELNACTEALVDSGWLDKTDKLIIGGDGEVFLSEHYKWLLYKGDFKRKRIQIMTNGTLFTEREWEKIEGKYEYISILVSVDAATKETYEKVRCGGNFDRLMKNMEFLSRLRRENKVNDVQVNMIVQRLNYKEIPDFIRWAKKMAFDRVFLSHIWNWGTFAEDEFENKVTMFEKNGKMGAELATVLEDPICSDPIVDMRWN